MEDRPAILFGLSLVRTIGIGVYSNTIRFLAPLILLHGFQSYIRARKPPEPQHYIGREGFNTLFLLCGLRSPFCAAVQPTCSGHLKPIPAI